MKRTAHIHPTACVHPGASLDENVNVGPYTIIGEKVCVGAETEIGNACVLDGNTRIGKRCRVFTGAVIGVVPQDLKYKGEDTQVLVGDDNVIREYVTINRATGDAGKTVIGSKNLFMAYAHVAHDCVVGDGAVIANVGTLAGHVTVENKAVIGGLSAVHQFARVGQLSIIGGCSKVVQDIPPFSMVDGHPARVYGLNSVGLKRAGISSESMHNLKLAFKFLFSMKLSVSNALKKVNDEIPPDPQVAYLVEFIKNSKRGICRGALRKMSEE